MSSETLTDFQIYHTPSKVPGKKGVPLAFISETLDFSQFNPYILDLSSLSQQGRKTSIFPLIRPEWMNMKGLPRSGTVLGIDDTGNSICLDNRSRELPNKLNFPGIKS